MNSKAISNNVEVANIILAQLGGNKFIVMTGARHFLAIDSGLQFKLPSRFATDGINVVRVILNGSDTYSVEFGKARGTSYKIVATADDVYADSLRDVFTEFTGLDTSL